MKKQKGDIYLVPNVLAEDTVGRVFPEFNKEIIRKLKYFIVEDVRNARRFLKKIDKEIVIDELMFGLIDKHSDSINAYELLGPVFSGQDCGIISEAGSPCIADPGHAIVAEAHRNNLKLIPLIGPNSIMMALETSGFNGQSFAFHGYLPINPKERNSRLRDLEKAAVNSGQTQIFMETPYRNMQLLEGIIANCHPETLLCIAANITAKDEFIKTKPIREWKKTMPELHKIPSVFLIGK